MTHLQLAHTDGRHNIPSIEDLASLLEDVVILPTLDRRVLEVVAAPDRENRFESLSAVLRSDPLLAARVLRVANSAYFGCRRSVGSVEVALAVLGTDAVCAIALAASFDCAFSRTATPRPEMEALRRHGLQTATMARRLAAFEGQADCCADEAFVAGLLHDLGTMVNLQGGSKLPQLGTLDHAFVGAALLTSWGMPASLVEAVSGHHEASASIPAGDARAVLWAADALANWVRRTDECCEEVTVTPEQLEDCLGLTNVQLLDLAAHGVRDARDVEALIR